MADSGKIPILYKGTGESTLGDSARNLMDRTKSDQSVAAPDSVAESERVSEVDVAAGTNQPDDTTEPKQPESIDAAKSNEKVKKKAHKEIENLEQFIEQAYVRPGQRISLKAKTEEVLGKSLKLPDEARLRLLGLAKRDWLLAVPRQLLLVSRDIKRFPLLKGEIRGFVGDVLAEHPIFTSLQLIGVVRNLPDAPDVQRALEMLAEANLSDFRIGDSEKPPKSKQLDELRANATYCLAIWAAETRSLSFERMVQCLYASLWRVRAGRIKGDTDKLRCLTDIKDFGGVGLACTTFKQQADLYAQAAAAAEKSRSAAESLYEARHAALAESRQEIDARDQKIQDLLKEIESEKQAHANTRTHLRDDHERLRARMLRRLKAEVSLLSEGLHALRHEKPKLHVVEDHAERVLDGLKEEIKELESGG